ncbi:DUF6879 family protein [Kitasatospora sp. NPDC048407]|uniref:DUF6879 family protein n=1 Tax=Kitasatospora sp. NPDC048407 TaxID=3364051 RepID=UPI0037115FBF
MLLDGEAWAARFRDFEREAWRLETLPAYNVPQEAEEIRAFKAGERIDPRTHSNSYTEDLRRVRREGKSKGRVHIVTRPLSDYLLYEFMYYEAHAMAGEEIRIMDVTGRSNPLVGVPDFWMFDKREVVLMNYQADGTQISREVYGGDPAEFVEYQRTALTESVPFEEYVKGLA